uniref:EsV-22-like protein n=1 Tax=Ectocarpus siliculosus TaxID=2880 RepID=B2KWI8_ECTSI|nr:EsV-22-like protein [Ectocarpus siliculosus]
MGCGRSRSSRTVPTVRDTRSTDTLDDDDVDVDKNDAPFHHTCSHCGRRSPFSLSSQSPSYASFSNSFSKSLHASFSNSFSNSFRNSYSNSYANSFSESIPSTGPWSSNSIHSRSLDDGSETIATSRSYSLRTTSSFHSPASNCRDNLALDPTLFLDAISPSKDGVRNTNIDTACGSGFSSTSLPLSRNNLALDPTLFPDVISPSMDGVRHTNIDTPCGSGFSSTTCPHTNIDTACGSRFSGKSRWLSSSSSAPSSHSSDERYPLPPLSVRTEPFPRLDDYLPETAGQKVALRAYKKMGITDSKVYDLEDKVVVLQREVKQLQEKMGQSTKDVEELGQKLQKQEHLTQQLDAFARAASDELRATRRARFS